MVLYLSLAYSVVNKILHNVDFYEKLIFLYKKTWIMRLFFIDLITIYLSIKLMAKKWKIKKNKLMALPHTWGVILINDIEIIHRTIFLI